MRDADSLSGSRGQKRPFILLASDHAGYTLKRHVIAHLERQSAYQWLDLGAHSAEEPTDYPDYAHRLARQLVQKEATSIGILLCGTGNGMAMVANKYKGIRAALCWDKEIAALARAHNHANVLCVPARFITQNEAIDMIDAFLASQMEADRHLRRVGKIDPER